VRSSYPCGPHSVVHGFPAGFNLRGSDLCPFREEVKDKKIEYLEAKLQRKNEVMAELMEEHSKLKKDLGEL
jgi:hypothetical protein